MPAYLNERDKVRESYSCLKMMMQAHVHTGFSLYFSLTASLKLFYLYTKLLQSSAIFEQKK